MTKNHKRAEAKRRLFVRLGYETRPVMPVYAKTHSNPQRLEALITRYGLQELTKPENAKWLALLIDTEGFIGWRRTIRRMDRINEEYRYTYIYYAPFISVGMKEIEARDIILEASRLMGVKVFRTRTTIHVTAEEGRAITIMEIIKPYLTKFKRMVTLLQAIFKYTYSLPSTTFEKVITKIFGKYMRPKEANDILLTLTQPELQTLLKKAEIR